MRRWTAISPLLFACAVLTGCGKSKPAIPDSEPPEVAEATPPDRGQPPVPPPVKDGVDTEPVAPAPRPVSSGIRPFAIYPQPKVEAPEPKAEQPMLNPNIPAARVPPTTTDAKKPPEPKEKTVGSQKETEWPTEIYGRTLADYILDMSDPDPATRHRAFVVLPGFGPVVRLNDAAVKGLLAHMDRIKEGDPGVRASAYEAAGLIGFEHDNDTKEAVRLLFTAADQGSLDGGPTRLHAVQTIGAFGSKASAAIPYLVGGPSRDRAYETRKAVANALGRIAFDEVQGPDTKAISCLMRLLDDHSAPVRLEASQALLLLGPPYLERPKGAQPLNAVKGPPPPVDAVAIKKYVDSMKKRLLPYKSFSKSRPSPTGLVETDKQVEIFTRLAIMRIDAKEMLNEEHLDRIVMYIQGEETGPKLQGLSALAMMGPAASKRIDDVVKVLSHEDSLVVNTAVSTLVAMGAKAEPALPAIRKLKDRQPSAKDPKEQEEEKKYWVQLSDEAVKLIQEAMRKDMAPAPIAMP